MLFRISIAALFLSSLSFATKLPPKIGLCSFVVVSEKGTKVSLGVSSPKATPINNPFAKFNEWGLDPTRMVESMKHGRNFGAYVRTRASFDLLLTETGLMTEYNVVRINLVNTKELPPSVNSYFQQGKKVLLAIQTSPTDQPATPAIVQWLDEVNTNLALGGGKVLLFDSSANCEFSDSIATYLNLNRPEVDIDLDRKMTP